MSLEGREGSKNLAFVQLKLVFVSIGAIRIISIENVAVVHLAVLWGPFVVVVMRPAFKEINRVADHLIVI